jgi:hypothetical protein
VGGILDRWDLNTSTFLNDFFKVEVGSVPSGGYNTLKIGTGKGVLHVENTTAEKVAGLNGENDSLQNDQLVTLFKWVAQDNIVVDGIAGYAENDIVFVGFLPIWNPLEEGVCALSTNNQVSISGGDFNKLRGQSTKNPTKVRFYDSTGAPAANSDTYEVISITSSTLMTISGTLTAESGLKMLIVGSYDLAAQGSLSDKYSYRTASGILTFTKTSTDITANGGFLVASLLFGAGGAFTITDLRYDNLFNFTYTLQGMALSSQLTVDNTFSGTVAQMPVASSIESPLAFGDVVCIVAGGTTGEVDRAEKAVDNPAIGIVVVGSDYPGTVTVLLNGFVRKTAGWAATGGTRMYLGIGAPTSTKTTTPSEMIQVIGIAVNTSTMYFNPSLSTSLVP